MLTEALYGRHELTVQRASRSDIRSLPVLFMDGLDPQGPIPIHSETVVAKETETIAVELGLRGFSVC